ncbi:YceI family protein [Streptomyces blattellae]|uniref:YceI family protein n=1 Tax=Streptomyces blattellae TaxID=2569855 RepID=UPI0012B879FF|nr:YceI family protein [Streptomyces blattellae]
MDPVSGKHHIGSETGRLRLKTGRAGLGRKAGHDLTIEVTRWSADVVVDVADPGQSSVVATIEVDSLEVREGAGGLKPLTDDDRADIKRTMREKILHSAEHPRITFTSTEVAGAPHAFTVTGDLTIMGTTRPITIEAGLDGEGGVHGTATLVQSTWGIKPYKAFAGTLRLADEVHIELDATGLTGTGGAAAG